ncbi:nucleoside-diphosphate kinase [Kitasatospora sp. DSM 101779]|uniref:nucleoside-diphosphate kinase n=1 Tax=Kitasatospora sp. DSM 101779 TaxID=2853165 RepID=UPI0021DA04D9|nr:nucleoside-diphosphate kinase [Kitasatospora sp. DSM 101779]MCU7822139.1 nucleoside-diphosphate kinase [Kitasatospora sp. DSM 101779]
MADFDYRRTALLVITPDAVRRHLARQVVSRVRAAGFTVAAHRLWPAAPPGLDPFHRRNEPVARDPRLRRTVEELFDLGPLLALGVQEGPGRPADGVHRRLAELKGRGDPAWSAPGSIRKDLGSINTVLNIVHSSDDAEDTAREAALFLEAGPGLPETGPAALDAAVRAAERGRPREDRGHDEVLGGVRARVLTGIRPSLPPEQREHADRWCEQHGAGGLAGPGGGALLAGSAARPPAPRRRPAPRRCTAPSTTSSRCCTPTPGSPSSTWATAPPAPTGRTGAPTRTCPAPGGTAARCTT